MRFKRPGMLLLLAGLTACVAPAPAALGGADAAFATSIQALTAAEYPLATWIPSPNFDVLARKPGDVTIIVIHTTEGTYQSAINWFEDPASQVSAHYIVSKKGDITQMVQEKDKAWHVLASNSYTIGIEHEGMIEDPNWVTEPMLDASAKLCCYLLKKWQLPATRDHIKGHVELPNQTHKDPGAYWPWDTYMVKVQACMDPVTANCGSCDDGNACTTDDCVAGACQHLPKDGTCVDGDPCTVGDYCAQGLCLSGASSGCGADATADGDIAAADGKTADGADGDPTPHLQDAAGTLAAPDADTATPPGAAASSRAAGCQSAPVGSGRWAPWSLLLFLGFLRLARRRA